MPGWEDPLPIGQNTRSIPFGYELELAGSSGMGIAWYMLSAGS